jgi:hypothetical protein
MLVIKTLDTDLELDPHVSKLPDPVPHSNRFYMGNTGKKKKLICARLFRKEFLQRIL